MKLSIWADAAAVLAAVIGLFMAVMILRDPQAWRQSIDIGIGARAVAIVSVLLLCSLCYSITRVCSGKGGSHLLGMICVVVSPIALFALAIAYILMLFYPGHVVIH